MPALGDAGFGVASATTATAGFFICSKLLTDPAFSTSRPRVSW